MFRPWFLAREPRITLPEGAIDDSEAGRGPLPDDLLADLPWVSDFDPSNPADQARLRLILRASNVKGQTFLVRSATDFDGEAVATFSSFPTSDEVSAAVAEKHSGGPHNVWSTKPSPHLLRTYFLQGSAPRRSAKSRQQERIAELTVEIKAALMESAMDHLKDHPEVFNELALRLLCKEIGVPVPEMPSFEEQIVNEAMREPEYRDEEAARIMELRKAEAARAAESKNLDDLHAYVKKAKRTVELMGYERGVKPNTGAGLDDIMKILLEDGGFAGILAAFKNVRYPRNPAQAPQASPGGEPPHAEEQHKTENGAHDSQVAEHVPSNRPPQAPAPQESPVKESPGSGRGPRRFDIGLPAAELGLLGLRGDTTFVDWPLV